MLLNYMLRANSKHASQLTNLTMMLVMLVQIQEIIHLFGKS